MSVVTKEMLEFVDKITEMFEHDFRNLVLFDENLIAVRTGVNETDLTIFESSNKVIFESHLKEQSVTRIYLDESNKSYDIKNDYKRLVKYLENNHSDILTAYKNNSSEELDYLF